MNRTDLINFYVKRKINCHYLEIGVGCLSANFNKITATIKDGVDPFNFCNNCMSSDIFFTKNKNKYDVIFIDGDHKVKQVIKDAANAMDCLNNDGVILMHDCNPLLEEDQTEEITNPRHWNGSVWKAVLFYRQKYPDMFIVTVDTDEGICIMKPDKKIDYLLPPFSENEDFNFLKKYRKDILNLITVEEWKKLENVL
jgi:hypothetical protein